MRIRLFITANGCAVQSHSLQCAMLFAVSHLLRNIISGNYSPPTWRRMYRWPHEDARVGFRITNHTSLTWYDYPPINVCSHAKVQPTICIYKYTMYSWPWSNEIKCRVHNLQIKRKRGKPEQVHFNALPYAF